MGLFYTPKPKQYKVEPRFWDPEKEKREARERRIKAELGIRDEDGVYRPYLSKGDFRRGLANTKWAPSIQRRRSGIRFLVLVALLAALLYFILR
ncbi:MAG: hypothetical protein K9H26_12210 [Prolixibacteraceae bacterium]|nr:hypothetical protein [Prolixibacteraceae bacterium]